MRYYTIQNNNILTAETRQALERFYDNVLELPEDYEQGKYIVVDGELVLNPNWEEEKEQQEIKKRKQEILNLLDKLDLKSIRAIRANDTEYINKYEEEAEALREELRNL